MKFFGFAMSDSMFSGDITVTRITLNVEDAQKEIPNCVPCVNPSHKATLAALKERFDVEVTVPGQPPRVSLGHGDSLVVMTVRGLPRLTDRHEYTSEEIAGANFTFARWDVK